MNMSLDPSTKKQLASRWLLFIGIGERGSAALKVSQEKQLKMAISQDVINRASNVGEGGFLEKLEEAAAIICLVDLRDQDIIEQLRHVIANKPQESFVVVLVAIHQSLSEKDKDCISRLRTMSDSLIAFSVNDERDYAIELRLAEALHGLHLPLTQPAMMGMDFEDWKGVLKNSIGVFVSTVVRGEEWVKLASEYMFCGLGADDLMQVRSVLWCISCGEKITMNEIEDSIRYLKSNLEKDVQILFNAPVVVSLQPRECRIYGECMGFSLDHLFAIFG